MTGKWDSLQAGSHPLLWVSLLSMLGMTLFVVSSPLPVILDGYLHDDSFYYLKTAENFAAGHGSSFDGINYTNGYQPGWFAVLTALSAAGVSHDAMVRVAIVVQSLFFGAGIIMLAAAFVAAGIQASTAAVAIGIVFSGLVPVLGWNLLESGLTFFASSSLLFVLARRDASPFAFGLVLAFAGIARTDHLLFVPLVWLWLWWQRWRSRLDITQVMTFALPLAGLIGGYLLLNQVTTGHIMPVSGRVKALYSSEWNAADTLRQFLQIDVRQSWKLGLIAVIAVLVRDARQRRLSAIGLYGIGAVGICAYYQLTYTSSFNAAFWYYIPLYILFCFSIAAGLDWLSDRLRSHRRWALAIMTAMMLVTLLMRARVIESYLHRPEGERAHAYRIALVLRDLLADPSVKAAAWDSGMLGYYGGAVTNLDGLVNSADYFERYLSHGRVADYIREHRFSYLVCYEPDTQPGGKAFPVVGDYRPVHRADSWVILERKR